MNDKKPQQLDKKLRGSQKKIEGTFFIFGAFYFFLRAALYKIPVNELNHHLPREKNSKRFFLLFLYGEQICHFCHNNTVCRSGKHVLF